MSLHEWSIVVGFILLIVAWAYVAGLIKHRRHRKATSMAMAMTYDEARIELAERLEECARNPSHPNQAGYDQIDGSLNRGGGSEWGKLFVALSFWDGWIDASNHEWHHYEPISKSDWPKLALELAAALREDNEVVNPIIVEKFDFRSRELRK